MDANLDAALMAAVTELRIIMMPEQYYGPSQIQYAWGKNGRKNSPMNFRTEDKWQETSQRNVPSGRGYRLW